MVLVSRLLILFVMLSCNISAMQRVTPDSQVKEPAAKRVKIEERDQNTFNFKIGFEFQLSGGIFSSYFLDRNDIQKKPLFELKYKDRKLWHAVMDGRNIEFVTEPFSPDDEEDLKLCLTTIQHYTEKLHNLMEENKTNKRIPIMDWINKIELGDELKIDLIFPNLGKINMQHPYVLSNNKLAKQNGKLKEWQLKFTPQVTIQHPLEYTIPLCFGLFGFDNQALLSEFFDGIPNYNKLSKISNKFDKFKEKFRENGMLAELMDKLKGLVFIHAMTISKMAPPLGEQTDKDFLKEISKYFKEDHQIDPKRYIHFMSRRPFSSMFNDIKEEYSGDFDYRKYFSECIEKGNNIFKENNLMDNFYKTNYGEQLFEENNSRPKDISNLIKYFNKEFIKENGGCYFYLMLDNDIENPEKIPIPAIIKNSEDNYMIAVNTENGVVENIKITEEVNLPSLNTFFQNYPRIKKILLKLDEPIIKYLESRGAVIEKGGKISELLKKGVIGTVMLRNLADTPEQISEIFNMYYEDAIRSVQNPTYRYQLNSDKLDLEKVEWGYDTLSPPWFLHEDNSMGRYKEPIDKSYGEAIVEFRNIRRIGQWFLNQTQLNNIKYGDFLLKPEIIPEHGIKLFNFLKSFLDRDKLDDINMGICYTLAKE